MIVAGIVLFNPDLVRLSENLNAVLPQVDKVICVDNGSENIEEIKNSYYKEKKIRIIENHKNLGIATALNKLVEEAEHLNAQWVLTLDQDSVVYDGIINVYNKFVNQSNIGLITCIISDRNTDELIRMENDFEEVKTCITSGSYIKVEAWKKSGGFDEKMFIDWVDFDICYSLMENGYKIIRVNFVGLLHEVGLSRCISIFGKKHIVFNHSSKRKYFIVRNQLYFIKKHCKYVDVVREYYRLFRYILLVIIFEDNKIKKTRSMIKGFYDGIKM